MKLIDDDVLGFLMRVAFGFDDIFSKKGFALIPYKKDPWSLRKTTGLQNLILDYPDKDIYNFRITMGGETVRLLRMHAQELRNKANGSMPFGSSGDSGYAIHNLFIEADDTEKYANRISKKYSFGDQIEPEDKEKLMGYWDVPYSLVYQMSLTEQQLKNLNEFLGEYSKSYSDRDLEGQEEIPLAGVLANNLLTQYSKPEFVARYGAKRVAQAGWEVGMFCHSLMYLNDHSSLELLDLEELPVSGEQKGRTYWKATFNNLSLGSVSNSSVATSARENEVIASLGKLKIVKYTTRQIKISLDGFRDSEAISANVPWFKVFEKFVIKERLTKREIEAVWNLAEKGKYKSRRKIRTGDGSYASTITSEIRKALKRNCSDIAERLVIKRDSGTEFYVLKILS